MTDLDFPLPVLSHYVPRNIHIVYGFIRESQHILCDGSFYNIPELISLICLAYFNDSDEWDTNCKSYGIEFIEDNCIKKIGRGNSTALLTKKISSGHHKWRFRMIKQMHAEENYIDFVIGIWNMNISKPQFIVNSYFPYLGGLAFISTKACVTIPDETEESELKYAVKCKPGDIIEMDLNMDDTLLSFKVNDIEYGAAFQVVPDVTYRAAVYLYCDGDIIKLLT